MMLIEVGSDFYKMNVKFTGSFLLRFPYTVETYNLMRFFFHFFFWRVYGWHVYSSTMCFVSSRAERMLGFRSLCFVTSNNKNVLLLFIIFISYYGLLSP